MNTSEGDRISSLLESLPGLISGVRACNRGSDPKKVIEARGALLDAAEATVKECRVREGRALNDDEIARVEGYLEHVAEINAALAEYKRLRESVNDSGLPLVFPF